MTDKRTVIDDALQFVYDSIVGDFIRMGGVAAKEKYPQLGNVTQGEKEQRMWDYAFLPLMAVGGGGEAKVAKTAVKQGVIDFSKQASQIGKYTADEALEFIHEAMLTDNSRELLKQMTKVGIPQLVKNIAKAPALERAEFNIAVREAEKKLMASRPLVAKLTEFFKSKLGAGALIGSAFGLLSINLWAEWAAADNVAQGVSIASTKLQELKKGGASPEAINAAIEQMEASMQAAEQFSEASQLNPLVKLLSPTFHQAIKVARMNLDLEKQIAGLPAEEPFPSLEQREAETRYLQQVQNQEYQEGNIPPMTPEEQHFKEQTTKPYGDAYKAAYRDWLVSKGRMSGTDALSGMLWNDWEAKRDFENDPYSRDAIAKKQKEFKSTMEAGLNRPPAQAMLARTGTEVSTAQGGMTMLPPEAIKAQEKKKKTDEMLRIKRGF